MTYIRVSHLYHNLMRLFHKDANVLELVKK